MQLTEITYANAKPVDGYGPGFFRVGGQVIEGGLLLAGDVVQPWAGLSDLAPIEARAGQFDVLLLGMGAALAPVPEALSRSVEAMGAGVEPMASPTACRTYNVLVAEGRRVVLAALPVAG